MPDLDNDIVGGKEGGTFNPTPSDPATPADEDSGFRWTRKQLIAMGVSVKPLTREEYLLSGDKESIGSPLNVKEQVLASVVGGGVEPEGTITITENGTGIDVAQYADATIAVPASAVVSGTKSITANGTNIDVTNYAKVDVNVPAAEYAGEIKVVNTLTDNALSITYMTPQGEQSYSVAYNGGELVVPADYKSGGGESMYSYGFVMIKVSGAYSGAINITGNSGSTLVLGRQNDTSYVVHFKMYEKTGIITIAAS